MEAKARPLANIGRVAVVVYGGNADGTYKGTLYAYSGGHGTMYVLGKPFSRLPLVGEASLPDGDDSASHDDESGGFGVVE